MGPGSVVGDRYELVRELGRGGMGVVYLGRDRRRDMEVAIKFRTVAERDAAMWLKREFRAVASLRHANLVELYELVAHEGSCYFTMEYVPGLDPRRWCETAATPDFERVRAVLVQLAEALAFLHARGVIHRDVKPSNTIVVATATPSRGAVKLLDFGLALEGHRASEDLARETRIVGTAAYLAPEYLERLEVTAAVDVYALGVLAFELATGAPPFGGTLHVLARLHRALSIPRASSLEPATPHDLDVLIAEMLAAEPAARPTAAEVAARLSGDATLPHVTRREPAFVGRASVFARLASALGDGTRRARLVVVGGPSGVGKTSLIDAACAAASDAVVWRGRCHDRERVPYRAFDAIVDDLASQLAGDRGRAGAIEHVAALARVFPDLAAVVDADALTAPPAGDLRVERERAQLALVQLFRELAPGEGTLCVVIDDLQWADDASLELLALLVERWQPAARPLVVIASWTTGDARGGLRALLARLGDAAEVIEVPALADGDVRAMLSELAPRAPATRLAVAARLAAGNPYLAQLIGRELAETDVDDATGAESRRLARLSPAERAVAEIAAIADSSTSFDELRVLAALPSVLLSSALRGLEHERVVCAMPSPSGDPVYAFYHQRLRDAAHAALAPDARRVLHERFANHLEASAAPVADKLAYHWERAGEPMRAARWAVAAADVARAQLAWDVAAAGYAHALALGATPILRAQLADCLFLAGKLGDAAREFMVLAGESAGGDRWRVRAAEAYIKLGEIDRGLALLDPVLERHGRPRARGRAGSLLRAAGIAARWIAPRLTAADPPDDVLASAYTVLAKFMSTPYPVESLEYVLRDAHGASVRGDTAGASTGMAMIAAYVAAGSLGRFGDRAIASAERLAGESGAPYPAMVTAGCAGIVAMLRGDWSGMRAQHEAGERICRTLGLERSWEASFLRSYWALGEYYAGDPRRAVAMLGVLADASDDMISRALLGSYRARALLVAGDATAASGIEAEIRHTPAARRGMASIYRQVLAAELALAAHDWPRAASIARELDASSRAQWLTAMPAVRAMVDVIEATAALGLAQRDRSEAEHARSVARALHRRGSASFYAPTALRLWGQAERRLGHAKQADRLLDRAAIEAQRRGGAIDQLATAALRGEVRARDLGPLAAAVAWSTGGEVSLL